MSAPARPSGYGIFLSAVLFSLVGCRPATEVASSASSERSDDDAPAPEERPVPSAEPSRNEQPPSDRKLPRPCADQEQYCSTYSTVIAAVEGGDSQAALQALQGFSAAESSAEQGLRLLLRGWALLESGSLAYGAGGETSSQARTLLQSALPLAKDQDLVRLHLARAQLSLGQGAEALSALGQLAERYPGDAEVQAALGIAYLATGRTARALAPLKKAVQLDPQEPERLVVLGTVHMLLGELSQAERRFRGAIALDGNSARAHGDLGAVLLLQGNVAEGKAHLLRAFQLSPESATFAANLSYAELLAAQAGEAEKWARKALELDPDLVSAWLNLGLAQVKAGAMDEARSSFEKARAIDPSDPRPENNLRDLDEIVGRKVAP